MKENIKKFFKNESLLMKTFPWTINMTNLFFLSLLFIPPKFIKNNLMLEITLFLLSMGLWMVYYLFFLRKNLLKRLSND